MIKQRTLSSEISSVGIGLHSGKKIKMTLCPAKENNGITFQRSDLPNSKSLKASATSVVVTENNTAIGSGSSVIHTVEHLMAVLYGLGVSNCHVVLDGPEVPIMDGSGASFLFLIKEAGIEEQNAEVKILSVKKEVAVQHQGKWAKLLPFKGFQIESSIEFHHPKINFQKFIFDFTVTNFIEDIVRARTFGFLKDVDYLKKRGLVKGGSLENAIVLDDFKVLNPEGLRFEDEFIRHKILDIVGDLSLLGYPMAAKVSTSKSGHLLNNKLCLKLLSDHNNYQILDFSDLEGSYEQSLFDLPFSYLSARNI